MVKQLLRAVAAFSLSNPATTPICQQNNATYRYHAACTIFTMASTTPPTTTVRNKIHLKFTPPPLPPHLLLLLHSLRSPPPSGPSDLCAWPSTRLMASSIPPRLFNSHPKASRCLSPSTRIHFKFALPKTSKFLLSRGLLLRPLPRSHPPPLPKPNAAHFSKRMTVWRCYHLEDGHWYPAKVLEVRRKNLYLIRFDHIQRDMEVRLHDLRVPEQGGAKAGGGAAASGPC